MSCCVIFYIYPRLDEIVLSLWNSGIGNMLSQTENAGKTYSVMLVDDEAYTRKLVGERISKIPGVTLAASLPNGFGAKRYLLEHVVDIVVTDIKMPLSDGLELAEFISEFVPSCPIIIISAYRMSLRVLEQEIKNLNQNLCYEMNDRLKGILEQCNQFAAHLITDDYVVWYHLCPGGITASSAGTDAHGETVKTGTGSQTIYIGLQFTRTFEAACVNVRRDEILCSL